MIVYNLLYTLDFDVVYFFFNLHFSKIQLHRNHVIHLQFTTYLIFYSIYGFNYICTSIPLRNIYKRYVYVCTYIYMHIHKHTQYIVCIYFPTKSVSLGTLTLKCSLKNNECETCFFFWLLTPSIDDVKTLFDSKLCIYIMWYIYNGICILDFTERSYPVFSICR